MARIKTTHKDPITSHGEEFDKDYKKTVIKTAPEMLSKLTEVDSMLNEKEQSLKKKIFSLAKMEALVFSDPVLSAKYEEMAENGEEKYGYHYNETIMNMLFNDYVLNSPKYLQKYKMAIPKEKKRRDKSGINQLKKAGAQKMDATGTKLKSPDEKKKDEGISEEVNDDLTKTVFLIHPNAPEVFAYFPEENHDVQGRYKTGYAHTGQHSAIDPKYAEESRLATPEEYQDLKTELEGQGYELEVYNEMFNETTSAGSAGGAAGYVGYAGPAAFSSKGDLSGDMKKKKSPKAKPISTGFALSETNYLVDPSGFEKYIEMLNEDVIIEGSTSYGGTGSYETPVSYKDDVKNVSREIDTDKEKKDLAEVGIAEPGKEKRAYGKSGVGVKSKDNSSAKEIPEVNKEIKKPFYKGGKVLKESTVATSSGQFSTKAGDKTNYEANQIDTEKKWKDLNNPEVSEIAKEKKMKDKGNKKSSTIDDSNLVGGSNAKPSYKGGKIVKNPNNKLNEEFESKAQQRYFYAKANDKSLSKSERNKWKKWAEEYSDETDFSEIPEKVNEILSLHDTVEYVSDRQGENPFEMHGNKWQFVNARYPDGKIDIGVYRYGQDVVYDYQRWQEEMGINENMNEDMNNLIEFDIPTWAVSALINADESGLSDEDQAKLNAFVQGVVDKYGNANFMLGDVDGKDDLGFQHSNDIDNLGSDVYRLYLNPTKNTNDEDMLQETHLKTREDKVKFIKQNHPDGADMDCAKKSDEEVDKLYASTEKMMKEKGIDPEKVNINEKSESESQRKAAGAALAAKRGEMDVSELYGAAKDMYDSMSEDELEDYASGVKEEKLYEKKWAQNVDTDEGKMHRLLNVPEDEDVEDHYSSGKKLAQDLIDKVGREEAAGMINFAANVNSERNIYDEAQDWLDKTGDKENTNENPMAAAALGSAAHGAGQAIGNRVADKVGLEEDSMLQSDDQTMANKPAPVGDLGNQVDMGTQQSGGLNEDQKLLEEIDKELQAFNTHHNKLKEIAEAKKTPSMVIGDRVRGENPKNFKKDIQHSGTKDVIDVEKELQWKDQQSEVDDPQKLGQDIEKKAVKTADMKSGEALKNVGNSTNYEGDEVPKRNLTSKEQEEVDLYRQGQHSLDYDNEPSERFVERMKADQGEMFDMGEKQKEFQADGPLYNKEPQPVQDTEVDKVQYDKDVKKKGDKVAWNERMGLGSDVKLNETMITGRYRDALNKNRLIEFKLVEVKDVEEINEDEYMELSFDGLGNTYYGKTVDKKVVVNEAVTNAMNTFSFYTDGQKVFSVKNSVKQLNESETKEEKPVVNEQQEKMKHLLGYDPKSYVSTKNIKL